MLYIPGYRKKKVTFQLNECFSDIFVEMSKRPGPNKKSMWKSLVKFKILAVVQYYTTGSNLIVISFVTNNV